MIYPTVIVVCDFYPNINYCTNVNLQTLYFALTL
jgi:hypothetical protein